MHPGARKKRKLSTPTATEKKEPRRDANPKNKKQQKREKERILLARASVIKEKYRRLVPAYDAPWKEPPHNATHWDHLLSEATWMWNDMAQERIWKEAVAKQLAHEALEHWKSLKPSHSSASSTEIVTFSKDEVFGVPLGRQFRVGLQEMARKSHKKKTKKYEKALRKFQREYEVEELAAIYGFEPDEGFNLLNIKIPTLPCVVAPNELEKDYYMVTPPKAAPRRRSTRPKSRTPAAQQMIESEEMLGTGSLISTRPTRTNDKRQRLERQVEPQAVIPRPVSQRGGRRREWTDPRIVPGSDISLSQPEMGVLQDPPTISAFLARNDDKLLFFASHELQANWQIVSDVMASVGIYKSPEKCRERMKSIETVFTQAQNRSMCARTQNGSTQGSPEDFLLKQLRAKAKDSLKKCIPEMLAGKFTQHTAAAHKKRCLKMKKALQEGNIGPPSYNVSQVKLSDDVVKAMGGRLATPKESWTEAHNHNIARHLAVEYRQRQLDAADIAARQRMWKASVSQPAVNGASSLETQQQKYQAAAQQQGSIHLAASLAETSGWGPPSVVPPGFMNSASSLGGGPVAGHIQAPWIPPPADVLKGMTQLPNMMGSAKAQGQPVMDGSSMMSPMRPGFRNVMPHLVGVQRHSGEAQMHGRVPRGIRPPHQTNVAAACVQRNRQQLLEEVFKRYRNNPVLLRQFVESNSCIPPLRQLIMKTLRDPNRMPAAMNPQMVTHPNQMQQRMAPPPATPQGMPPGNVSRMPPTVPNSGDLHAAVHPVVGMSHSNFAAPPSLEHPSQFNPRAAVPIGRDFVETPPHGVRPRPHRPSYPHTYEFSGQTDPTGMNVEMQQGGNAMFGAMSLRAHGVSPDLMNPAATPPMDLRSGMPVNSMDPRLHGAPEGTIQMMDPNYGLSTNGEGNPPDPNFVSNDSRGPPNRSIPIYPRSTPRPYGK